jgi:hypothetical protein
MKDESGDLLANSYNNLKRWRNYFYQLLNMHGVRNVRHTEMHSAEPVLTEPSSSEVQMADMV